MLIRRSCLQSARIVRPIYHGDFVQLICSDTRGLLSVYFENAQFDIFLTYLYKTNLDIYGLLIEFDRDRVFLPLRGKIFNRRPALRKALSA
jgi:hypothetical protein